MLHQLPVHRVHAHRRTALNALKDFEVFRNTSVRILADLVDQALCEADGRQRRAIAEHVEEVEATLLVALDRPLHVTTPTSSARVPALLPAGGVHRQGDPALRDRPLRVRSATGEPAHCLLLSEDALARARRASAGIGAGLHAETDRPPVAGSLRMHTVWVCEQPQLGAPLEALTHLLAAAIAHDLNEPVAIVVLRRHGPELLLWHAGHDGPVRVARPSGDLTAAEIASALADRLTLPFCHVLFVDPEPGADLFAPLTDQRFHRIVYVTDVMPTAIPAALEQRLVPEARNAHDPGQPYFSSFVASLVPGRLSDEPFSEPIPSEVLDADPPVSPRPGWRVRRDACRLPIDLRALARSWREWQGHRSTAPDFARTTSRSCREAGARWARALTNRRVGLAISGGGACSYRIVPLIRMLHERSVPIDVVSGVSGGALVAAYYCKEGLRGLDDCVARGPLIALGAGLAALSSRVVAWQLDWALGTEPLDTLTVRFVPITTALRENAPPEPHAVVGGTLGEAVRASGCAPVAFAPTARGRVRYADGAAATPVPARALRDYGADLVFACNAVAGPACGNPFPGLLGRLAYRHTLAGRFVDLWTSQTYSLRRISREVAEDAHVFFEPPAQDLPMLEAFQWYDAARIVAKSERSAALAEKVQECEDRWREFAAARAGGWPAGDEDGAGREDLAPVPPARWRAASAAG